MSMNTDKRNNNAGAASPFAHVAQDGQQPWSFSPAPVAQPSNTTFSFRPQRSRSGSDVNLDNEDILRARSSDSQSSTRLLNASHHDNGPGTSRHSAHIPTSYGGRNMHSSNMLSEPLPSHTEDPNPSLRQSKTFSAIGTRYHAPGRPRKSLSERLQVSAAQRPPPAPLPLDTLPQNHLQPQTQPDIFPLESPKQKQSHAHANATPAPQVKYGLPAPAEEGPHDFDHAAMNSTLVGAPRSRSASVSSTTVDSRGMQNVMMEAMKTIQRYESESEIQKNENERLTAHLALVEKEKEMLNTKVQRVKEASLQKLAKSAKNLETLRLDLVALKSDAQAFSTHVSLADVQEMKDTIAHALSASAKYLETKEGESGAEKTREVINELKLDCMNKQQVLDMLRDRLTEALAELAASKNRVFELEDSYATDRLALKHATGQWASTGSQVAELAAALKEQQKESLESISLAGSLEQQLQASQSEISRLDQLAGEFKAKAADASSLESRVFHLQSFVDEQKDKLKSLDNAKEENIQLKSAIKERDERIRVLEQGVSQLSSIKQKNTQLETLLENREEAQKAVDAELSNLTASRDSAALSNAQLTAQIHKSETKSKLLESELLTRSQHLEELRTIVQRLQGNLDASCQSVKELQTELASSCAREAASRAAEASEKAQRLEETRAKAVIAQRLLEVKQELQDVRAEVDSCQKRLEDTNTRLQSLQERFEEQSITLRLTRDTSAELQDRLVAAETAYAKDLEANCGSLRIQIAVLQEQKIALQSKHAKYKCDTEEQHKEYEAKEVALKTKHARFKSVAEAQRNEYEAKEVALMKRFEAVRQDAETNQSGLRIKLATLQEQNSASQLQLKESASKLQVCRSESAKKETELLQRIEDYRKQLDREVLHTSEMKSQAERELSEVIRQKGDMETRLAGIQKQLQVVPAPCEAHEEEIKRLIAEVSCLSSECDAMKKRTRALNDRYEQGDLDPEERVLIKTIIQATQSMHDHELAQAQNELNRSNKMISTLQDAKTMLESSLAKHLAAEAKLKGAAIKAGTSVMEYVNWPSSQADGSMDDSPAQDGEEPTTASENLPDVKAGNLEALPAFDPIQVPDSPDRPLAHVLRHSTPASNKNFMLPPAGTTRAYFSRLASEKSEEIGEFEEETLGTKRKSIQVAQAGKTEPASKPAKRTKMRKLPEDEQTQLSGEPVTIKTTYKSKRKRR